MADLPDSGLARFLEERANSMRANPTESEKWVWQVLRDSKVGVVFKTQVPMFRYILDFYCDEWKLCIELDGRFHRTYKRSMADKDRDAVLAHYGIKTVRIPSNLIFKSPQALLRLVRYAVGVEMFPESEYPQRPRNHKVHSRSARKRVWD